jgi:hypothetical protein
VAGLGLAMSISFSHPHTPALPILLMGILIVVFVFFEARHTAISMFGATAPDGWRPTSMR